MVIYFNDTGDWAHKPEREIAGGGAVEKNLPELKRNSF